MPPVYQVCPKCRVTLEVIGCTRCWKCGEPICGYSELKPLFGK